MITKRNCVITGLLLLALPLLDAETVDVSSGPVTLSECRAIAANTYEPLKLAEQEVKLADFKCVTAGRALYPSLTAKAEQTNGDALRDVGTPGFREESYGLQMAYALFQGGKLQAAHQQAVSAALIAKLKYDKTHQEMLFGVSEAYWNLVRIYNNMTEYNSSKTDLLRIYGMAKELFSAGAINEREGLSVESQKNQSIYQLETAEADLENYRWKLADALGYIKPIDGLPEMNIPSERITVDLDQCLLTAEASHPDMLIQKETLVSARAALKVKRAHKLPKLDLNGFYGRSGGAFDGEDLNLTEDYQIGVQFTESFWLNTLTASENKQKTSPKLGQSTRTESDTTSAAVNILDGYIAVSEEREALLMLNQAEAGLKKTRFTVLAGVREAYFNYRKAIAQMNNAKLDADIAKRELAISEINMGNDKSSIVNFAEARNKLASSNAAYNDAKVFYLVSLNALNKAVGIEDKFTAK